MTDTVEIIFKGTDRFTGVADSIGGSFGRLGNVMKGAALAGVAGLAALGGAAVMGGAKLISLGSNAEETGSLIATSLGGAAEGFNETLRQMASDMNRSFYELQQGSSTLVAMTKSMGASEQQAADFGTTFAGMASDLGSFFNRTDSEVFLDLQSAMGGSSEVLQKYGVDIRETTLKQMALNQGLVENTTDILPPLIRAQLIQQAITEQAADAMGDAERTSGSWANSLRGLTGKIKDAATAAGTQLLPVMTPLLNLVGDLAAQAIPVLTSAFEGLLPMLQTGAEIIRQFIGNLQEGMSPIDAFIEAVWDFFPQEVLDRMVDIRDNIIPTIMAKIQEFLTPIQAAVAGFFEWKDVLIALALVLAGVVLSAIISVVTALGPILLALGAIVAAVAIVRQVWENDWLGIRTALEGVWLFLQPTLQTLWEWLQVNIPAAIEVLRGFWEDTLLPAIKAVWEFLSTYVIPVFRAIVEVWLAALQLGLTALAGIWQNVLLPAITAVWSFIKDKLGPVFEWLKSKVIDPVVSSFGGLEGKISSVLGWLGRLRDSLDSITLPDWMTPGSPTPWELGLRGVRDELQALYRGDLPALSASMQGLQNISNRTQNVNQTTNIYTSRVDTRQESAASVRFALGGI